MEMSPHALRAKSAREHRLKVRRLKIAETMKNQKSDGQDGNPGPKRRREENFHVQPMMPASSSSSGVKAINGRDDDQLPSHGCASVCGRRREMEDTLTLAPQFIGPDHDFFGVYDGHGGSWVAQACAARLHHLLLFEMQRWWAHCGAMCWEEVMEACFLRMDNEVGAQAVGNEEMTVGSTAVVAIVGPRYLIVANCGDSRAVLSRGRRVIPLTNDHKPNRPDEMQRIEAAGGRVISWDGPRVLGVLATSRSIGDHYLKPYVIPNPEVVVIERTEMDEFLILASDGLWDVISNETASNVVWRYLIKRQSKKETEKVGGPVQAATMLIELAVGRGSGDNISVVVVDLRSPSRSFL